MKKTAYDNPAWVMVPGHRMLFGANPDVRKFPRVFSDDNNNQMLWSTLGAVTTTGILSALITHIANKRAIAHLKKVQGNVHAAKVNAIATGDVDELPKEASSDSATAATTIVPLLAATLAGVGVHNMVNKGDSEEYEAELDKKIAAQRDRLQVLYKKLEGMYASDNNFELAKSASGTENPSMFGRISTLGKVLLWSSLLIPAYAAYEYTRKHSDEVAAQKVLERDILPSNLTNIPDSVALQLNPHRD